MSNSLVAYFSATGTTKKIASNILKTFKDQELDVYLQAKLDYKEWKASDELLELSSRVLNLVKRLVVYLIIRMKLSKR